MGVFSVFTALFTYLFPPSLAKAAPPRDRLRGCFAFVIYDFGKISYLVKEKPLNREFKSKNYKHENTGAGLSYSGRNGQWKFPY